MSVKRPEILIPAEFAPLMDADYREAAVHGGRASLKSGTIARILLMRASEKPGRCGCFREFQNSIKDSVHSLLAGIIEEYEIPYFKVTNDTIINTKTGYDFIFRGLKNNEQSIKSIDGLTEAWVEEAQTVSERSIEVLTPTVRLPGSQIIYSYNRLREADPVHKRLVIDGRPNTLVIFANYDVADKYGLFPDVLRAEMEDDKANRPKLYKHKWLGEPMNVEGKIFTDWKIIDEIPHEARLEVRGLDFGYARDPMALCDIYYYNGGYIIDELARKTGMLNRQTADIILAQPEPNVLTIADSAEQKSIAEMQEYGVNITGVIKKGSGGKKFTVSAIQFVQAQRISITRRSKHYIESYQNFMWQTDKDGEIIDEYDHFNSDEMMSVVYGMTKFNAVRDEDEGVYTSGNIRSLW